MNRRRLTNGEFLRVDSDRHPPPSAAQLGRDCEADDAATDYGNGRAHSTAAHIAHQCLDMVRDHTGATEAQSNSGATMPIVVDQELGSEPARNGFRITIFSRPTDAVSP